MPHGGYHGVVKDSSGKILQQGSTSDGQGGQTGGGVYNPQGYATEIAGSPAPNTTQNISQQIADKKKQIELLNIAQEGITGGVNPNIDQQVDVIDQGFFNTGLTADGPISTAAGLAPGATFPITGATGIDAINLAKQQNFQNQQLNNLLQQQQEINLANQIKDSFATYGSDKETAENLRKLFTGDLGDNTFLGMNFGSTETTDPDKTSGLGAATVINPYTGERITTGKIREGMASPEYDEYMSDLYDLNPALMQQIFPFGSGQIAKPLFVKALDAVKGVGSGIAGLPGINELGQMVGDVGSAIVSPLSSLFTGQSTTTPKIQYDNMGNAIGFINPKAPTEGGGIPQAVDKFGNMERKLPYIHSGEIPAKYLDGFTKFYQNYEGPIVGGAAITGVTLPDGSVVQFGDTGSARVFREYLESIGAMQPEKPSGLDAIIPPKFNTGLPALADYASMAPQFTGSQYTNQGVSPAFLENLRKFYG